MGLKSLLIYYVFVGVLTVLAITYIKTTELEKMMIYTGFWSLIVIGNMHMLENMRARKQK